jgi:hypothetical protein
MATIQLRSNSYRILFFHHGKRYAFTLGEVTQDEAESKAEQVEYLLMRLKQRYVRVPAGVEITDFVAHDGNVLEAVAASPKQVAFADFKERYIDTYRNGGMEANSLQTVAMHLGHFEKTLGQRFVLQDLTLGDLQRHVNRRREKKYRGKQLSLG